MEEAEILLEPWQGCASVGFPRVAQATSPDSDYFEGSRSPVSLLGYAVCLGAFVGKNESLLQ